MLAKEKDTRKEDFTVSFALLLHHEKTLDFWNLTEPMHWRNIFVGGLYWDWDHEEATALITVWRPNNTISYKKFHNEFGVTTPFPDGVWTQMTLVKDQR